MKHTAAITWTVCIAGIVTVPGCTDSRFEEAQAARNDRMLHNFDLMANREAENRKNMENLYAAYQLSNERAARSMEWTGDVIDRRSQQRDEERERHIKTYLKQFYREHPEEIPDTFAKMFY